MSKSHSEQMSGQERNRIIDIRIRAAMMQGGFKFRWMIVEEVERRCRWLNLDFTRGQIVARMNYHEKRGNIASLWVDK